MERRRARVKERLEKLASLVDGELSPEEARSLLAEAYRDPELAEELSLQREVKEALRAVPAELPDAHLTTSTLAIIRRQVRERQRHTLLLRRTALALATSAAALLVGLLWVGGNNQPNSLNSLTLSGSSDPAAQVLMGQEPAAHYLSIEEVERQRVPRPADLPEVIISLHQVGKVSWEAEMRGTDLRELEVGTEPEPAPLPEAESPSPAEEDKESEATTSSSSRP